VFWTSGRPIFHRRAVWRNEKSGVVTSILPTEYGISFAAHWDMALLLALRTHCSAFLCALSNSMSPIEQIETSVGYLQLFSLLFFICYLLAVLSTVSSGLSERRRRLQVHAWSSFEVCLLRACFKNGCCRRVCRGWRRIAYYFLAIWSSCHVFVQDLQEFCDSAFRNTFLLSVNRPASARVSWKSAQYFWC